MSQLSRRRFLENSMFAATAAAMAGGTPNVLLAKEAKQSKSPNERLGVAVIGVKGRGTARPGRLCRNRETQLRSHLHLRRRCRVGHEASRRDRQTPGTPA